MLTIEQAVCNESTRYNRHTCAISVLNIPYGVTVIGGVQEAPSISSQLFHIPGVDVATVVLEVVAKTIVHVPWRAQLLRDSEIHPAVAVFKITPLNVTYLEHLYWPGTRNTSGSYV